MPTSLDFHKPHPLLRRHSSDGSLHLAETLFPEEVFPEPLKLCANETNAIADGAWAKGIMAPKVIRVNTEVGKLNQDDAWTRDIDALFADSPAIRKAQEHTDKMQATLKTLQEKFPNREFRISLRRTFIQRRYGKRWNRVCMAHGAEHSKCRICGGASVCVHKKLRSHCKLCGGSQMCPHGRHKRQCIPCGGKEICEHKKRRSYCKLCKGSQICEHNRERAKCKICKGSQVCEHGKERTKCAKCGGGSVCEHGRQRSYCKECKGSQICPCGNFKRICPIHGKGKKRKKARGKATLAPSSKKRKKKSATKPNAEPAIEARGALETLSAIAAKS